MHECPCCCYPLMQHIENNKICWFCNRCWATMPVFYEVKYTSNIKKNEELNTLWRDKSFTIEEKILECS